MDILEVKQKLADLKPTNGRWLYTVGNFTLAIFPYEIGDVPPDQVDSPLRHEKTSVVLNETTKSGVTSSVHLRDDPRFKNYTPIQYNVLTTPNGTINLSNGDNMPLSYLCELIRYLHRLSNLTAFM